MSENVGLEKTRAIDLYLRGYTNKQVANELKVCERTIERWKKTEDFQQELTRQTEEMRATLHPKLVKLFDQVITRLHEFYSTRSIPEQNHSQPHQLRNAIALLKACGAGRMLSEDRNDQAIVIKNENVIIAGSPDEAKTIVPEPS